MRVLVSAFTCIPGRGSEPGAGWGFLQAAVARHDVTAIVQAEDAPAIAAALRNQGHHQAQLIGINIPRPLRRWRATRGIGHVAYFLWQARAAKMAQAMAADFDVAHHVTYGADWMPAGLWAVTGIPVVWGPVGGGTPFRPRLAKYLSIGDILRETLRDAVTRTIRAAVVKPLVRRRCDVVVACNFDVARHFSFASAVVVESQVALDPLDPSVDSGVGEPENDQLRTAIFCGRLEGWKGPYLALAAFAKLRGPWELEFYGDGRERSGLAKRTRKLGLQGRVHFHGQCSRQAVRTAMRRADVLLFPSFHDASGFVVAEAIQVGCPVVCLDVGGPAMLVSDGGGIAVRIGRRLPERLADAVEKVHRQPPSASWDTTRLPDRVTHWYELARGRYGASRHS